MKVGTFGPFVLKFDEITAGSASHVAVLAHLISPPESNLEEKKKANQVNTQIRLDYTREGKQFRVALRHDTSSDNPIICAAF